MDWAEKILEEINKLKQLIEYRLSSIRITPEQVQIGNLSELSRDAGLLQYGEFRSGIGEPGDSDRPFTGVRMGYPGFTYNNTIWNIVGVDADTMQFGLRATDGVAVFGEGTATLDNDGLTFTSSTDDTLVKKQGFTWHDTGIAENVCWEYAYYREDGTKMLRIIKLGGDTDDPPSKETEYSIQHYATIDTDAGSAKKIIGYWQLYADSDHGYRWYAAYYEPFADTPAGSDGPKAFLDMSIAGQNFYGNNIMDTTLIPYLAFTDVSDGVSSGMWRCEFNRKVGMELKQSQTIPSSGDAKNQTAYILYDSGQLKCMDSAGTLHNLW